jgi:spore coat protein H
MAMTPSFMREKLSEAMYESMGGKIQRMSYAQLFVNQKHFGFYVMMEDPSEPFLQSRFGNSDGALYKCQADLLYYGPDPSTYQHLNYSGILLYKPRTPAAENYTALTHFITVLNLTPDDKFVSSIEQVLDVDLFLRTFAASVLSGNVRCRLSQPSTSWSPCLYV